MIIIRADSNEQIATGHIMRCISIAEALHEMGEKCLFITADTKSDWILQDKGYESLSLNSCWSKMDDEIDDLLSVVKKLKAKLLLIDSYFVTKKYMKSLSEIINTVYIDDLGKDYYDCNILINYSVYAEKFSYYKKYPNSQLLLGCDYVPLRKQFAGIKREKTSKEIMQLLLLTGGADAFHFAFDFASYFLKTEKQNKIKLDIICGGLSRDYERLIDLTKGLKNIRVLRNIMNIEEYMLEADMAISAGGFTLYELCACGTPSISYSFADNQLFNVEYFSKKGLIPYVGDLRSNKVDVIIKILDVIKEYRFALGQRDKISQNMMRYIDGYGSKRIGKVLCKV